MDGHKSGINDLLTLKWFIALWAEEPVEDIPMQYKEELSITLIEATLQVREDLLK